MCIHGCLRSGLDTLQVAATGDKDGSCRVTTYLHMLGYDAVKTSYG